MKYKLEKYSGELAPTKRYPFRKGDDPVEWMDNSKNPDWPDPDEAIEFEANTLDEAFETLNSHTNNMYKVQNNLYMLTWYVLAETDEDGETGEIYFRGSRFAKDEDDNWIIVNN